jgi:cobalt-zinc-cadmium efflux system outer membrane protein
LETNRRPSIGCAALACVCLANPAFGQVKITLDEAIQMALHHNHALLAARSTIQQNEAQEITANLRPNPSFFVDWEYLPLGTPSGGVGGYLANSTEGDIGLSYLFERGKKRQHRLQAAKDATAVTRSQVADNERSLTFQVATLFVNAQLAESTLELAREDLRSFRKTVDLGEIKFKAGSMSENDYLKIKLQLLQFQTDVQQAELARAQALSDLRQLLGYDSVSRDYDVAGAFEYQPLPLKLDDLQTKAIDNRPDLRAAVQGITAANSQFELAKANGKQDFTLQANYSHVNGISASTVYFSIPLAFFDRNQGEIARTHYAITQAQEQQVAARGQVMTDVRDAFEDLQTNDQIVKLYQSGSLEVARKSRDISQYAYNRGAASLLDFLDAERSYRATELAYRQAIAAYLLALEQVRESVGTRALP